MAILSTKFVAKYKHLVFKFNSNEFMMNILRNIAWFSFPIVYPNFHEQYKVVEYKYLLIRAKRKRYRNHLRQMLYRYGDLYLVTLTFGDCYDSTSSDTRKKYALRWLNEYTLDYFACLDIGKKNGREHFHCICALDTSFSPLVLPSGNSKKYLDFPELHFWSYGFSSCKIIKTSNHYSALDYAFKSALYSFKSADSNSKIKPFHKRGIDYTKTYYYSLSSDSFLF